MDSFDRGIIRTLQRDGRITNNEIADKINLSPSPCLRRLRNLERDGVITGYTAIVDHEKYGLPITVFAMIRLDRHDEKTVAQFERRIGDVPEILECHLMAGADDYLLLIVAESLRDYERFVKTTLHRIPGIAGIVSHFAYGTVKRTFVLPDVRDAG